MQDAARNSTTQSVAYTGTAAASSNATSADTKYVRIVATSACHYTFGTAPTAVTSDPFLPANWVEYVNVPPAVKISAVRAGTDGLVTATSGTLYITELT